MNNPIEINKNTLSLECDCGCSILKFMQWSDEDGGDVFIGHYLPTWDSLQINWLDKIKRKLKIIWNIILGKEFCFYEIIISGKEDIAKFKKYVSELNEGLMA